MFNRAHYEDMVKLSPEFSPMLEGCLENRTKWVEIEEGKEDKDETEKSGENSKKNVELVTTL